MKAAHAFFITFTLFGSDSLLKITSLQSILYYESSLMIEQYWIVGLKSCRARNLLVFCRMTAWSCQNGTTHTNRLLIPQGQDPRIWMTYNIGFYSLHIVKLSTTVPPWTTKCLSTNPDMVPEVFQRSVEAFLNSQMRGSYHKIFNSIPSPSIVKKWSRGIIQIENIIMVNHRVTTAVVDASVLFRF